MKHKSVLILILVLLAGPVISQRLDEVGRELYYGAYEPISRTLNYAEIQGSPYLDDDLVKGYVKFIYGDSTVQFLRYNIYTDEVEYLADEKLLVIKNATQVHYVYVNGHWFYYKTYKFRNAFKKGFLEKLVSGHFELYVKYAVDYEKKKNPESSYEKATPDRFVRKLPTYYFAIDNGPIINFDNSKSGLEEIFREDYPEIKKLIKSEKLKLRQQEDLVKIFEYYNSLE